MNVSLRYQKNENLASVKYLTRCCLARIIHEFYQIYDNILKKQALHKIGQKTLFRDQDCKVTYLCRFLNFHELIELAIIGNFPSQRNKIIQPQIKSNVKAHHTLSEYA